MTHTSIRIATRESPLALWQANHIKQELLKHYPSLNVSLLPTKTQGDHLLEHSLSTIGGKGLFTKELDQLLLAQKADIAVHSMKDVPAQLPEGLDLAIICQRADPRDVFVSNTCNHFLRLPPAATVGTASLRRQAQLKKQRPDIQVELIRGNIGTRIAHLDAAKFDAIILAAAGLQRLGLAQRIRHYFQTDEMIPAIGQGALGIACLTDNHAIHTLLKPLHDAQTALCVQAERRVNHRLQGDCRSPIAAFAKKHNAKLVLTALVGMPDGSKLLLSQGEAHPNKIQQLAGQVADELINQGAMAIIERFKN